MKKYENLNEEFEITPSNPEFEEFFPDDGVNDLGEVSVKDSDHENAQNESFDEDNIDTNTGENPNTSFGNAVFEQDDINLPSLAKNDDVIDSDISLENIVQADSAEGTSLSSDTEDLFEENTLFEDSSEITDNEDLDSFEESIDNMESDETEDNFEVDEDHYEADKKGKPKAEESEEKVRKVDSLFDFIELFVFTLAAVFIITSFFFRYSIVDGGSMKNTLKDDEKLILRCIFYSPECGDIVVVQDKSTSLKDPIVKRVIAVGGQTVKFTRDAVYVDGTMLDEPYVYTDDYENPFGGEDIYRYSVYPSDALLHLVTDRENGVFYEIKVPEGEIFVMGDHRNNSKDSREIGTLHEDAVIGKVVLRFFPFSEFGKIE